MAKKVIPSYNIWDYRIDLEYPDTMEDGDTVEISVELLELLVDRINALSSVIRA